MKNRLSKILIFTIFFFAYASLCLSQDKVEFNSEASNNCKCDFDGDGDVDGQDLADFAANLDGSDGTCGVDWQLSNPVPDQILAINSVCCGDGQFVAAAGFPGGFLTSPDGIDWTWRTLSGTQTFDDVTWGGNQFVAAGKLRTTTAGIMTSPDGVTWNAHDPGTTNQLYGVTWNGSLYVAVGGENNLLTIITSPNGEDWTWSYLLYFGGTLRSVAWSGSQYVAVGWGPLSGYSYGPAPILTSPDGMNWTQRTSGTTQLLYDVTWSGNKFVAVGAGNISGTGIQAVILTSPDGVIWTEQNSGTTNDLKSVIWGGNQFVAVGLNGTILTSPDGVTWTAPASGITAGLSGVTWGMDRFVAVGQPSTILFSLCDEELVVTPADLAAEFGRIDCLP